MFWKCIKDGREHDRYFMVGLKRPPRAATHTRLFFSVPTDGQLPDYAIADGAPAMASIPCIDDDGSAASIRVLVVEDYIPFRQFLCSTLGEKRELRIVGEAADGLEAVQKAKELKPDLILLDIGLPSLNGIEAARQIRKLAPQSKIVFVSQESSADIVQEALSLGALGYVVKMRAGTELLAAVEAVLDGRRFVSQSVAHFVPTEITPGLHSSTRP
jgi:CheY-like chemotaxis protein